VDPICEKYPLLKPFKGAVLSGQFTENAMTQLKNDGFHVLYIPFAKMVEAFRKYGLDIDCNEKTKESEFREKYSAVSKQSNKPLLEGVRQEILQQCMPEINRFVADLTSAYNKKIRSVCVLPLHGKRIETADAKSAIAYLRDYEDLPEDCLLEYVEVFITYNNGTMIHCQFKEKEEAIDFLNRIA
jgi:hypothetical protein